MDGQNKMICINNVLLASKRTKKNSVTEFVKTLKEEMLMNGWKEAMDGNKR